MVQKPPHQIEATKVPSGEAEGERIEEGVEWGGVCYGEACPLPSPLEFGECHELCQREKYIMAYFKCHRTLLFAPI